MCMLTFLPSNVQPNPDHLTEGARFNKDGHGFAIVVPATADEPPRLIVRHHLDFSFLLAEFISLRAIYPDGPALFHSRYGTSGSDDKYNCHPFRINKDHRTVVAHNGVLPERMLPHPTDRRCDTRKAADERFATYYGHLSDEVSRELLGEDIGSYNKLVILTIDPAYPEFAYIINEDSGVWEGDTWYSNSDYLPYTPQITGGVWLFSQNKPNTSALSTYLDHLGSASDGYIDLCPLCQSYNSINWEDDICEMCNSCISCEMDITECICLPYNHTITTPYAINHTNESDT